MSNTPIDQFVGEYAFLSNFYPSPVLLSGWVYPTVEHAYQAAKTEDKAIRMVFLDGTAGQAKRRGRMVQLRPNWESIKLDIMKDLIDQKFAPTTNLAIELVATGDRELIEGNNWGDQYWGVYRGKGQNWLGILLMERRKELQ